MAPLLSNQDLLKFAKNEYQRRNIKKALEYVKHLSQDFEHQNSDFLAKLYWRASCIECIEGNRVKAEIFVKKVRNLTKDYEHKLYSAKLKRIQFPLKDSVRTYKKFSDFIPGAFSDIKTELSEIENESSYAPHISPDIYKPEIEHFSSPFRYRPRFDNATDPISKIVRNFKSYPSLVEGVSGALASFLKQNMKWCFTIDLIVPVPLHKNRLKKRGYNQAELLSAGVGRRLFIPVCESLVQRVKDTIDFRVLSHSKRRKEIEGAFQISNNSIIKNRNILIIDDVVTSGATMKELAKVLLQAGAAKVYGAALCKTESIRESAKQEEKKKKEIDEWARKKMYPAWLSMIPKVGPLTFRQLVSHFRFAKDVYETGKEELKKVSGIKKNVVENILTYQKDEYLNKAKDFLLQEITQASKQKCCIYFLDDPEYPPNFNRKRHEGPVMLYAKGDILKVRTKDIIAVVGTRNPSSQSRLITRKISAAFAKQRWVISSGVAKGIDREAHLGAIESKMTTAGILGCGIDIVYPPEHKELYRQVVENGVIITQFPFGSKPEPDNLKKRNRTIGAISRAIIIAEAPIGSGAFNAVRYALEKNLPLFALEPYDKIRGSGNIKLIACGEAIPVHVDYYGDFDPFEIVDSIANKIKKFESGILKINPKTKISKYWEVYKDKILEAIRKILQLVDREMHRKRPTKTFLVDVIDECEKIDYDFVNNYISKNFPSFVEKFRGEYLKAKIDSRKELISDLFGWLRKIEKDRKERICIDEYKNRKL